MSAKSIINTLNQCTYCKNWSNVCINGTGFMKSTSKLSRKLLSKNSSDNLASCSNWELIKEMCVKSAILDHSKMTYSLCHTSPVSNVTTEDSYMLNTRQDFWLANCKLGICNHYQWLIQHSSLTLLYWATVIPAHKLR